MVITANPPKFDKRQPSKGGYDVIVYIDGSQIIAEDSNGRKICPPGVAGTDDAAIINAQCVSGNHVLLMAGNYVPTSTIVVQTGSELDFMTGATFVPFIDINVLQVKPGGIARNVKIDVSGVAGFSKAALFFDGNDDYFMYHRTIVDGYHLTGNFTGIGIHQYIGTATASSYAHIVGVNIKNGVIYNFYYGILQEIAGHRATNDWINSNIFDSVQIEGCVQQITQVLDDDEHVDIWANKFTNVHTQATVGVTTHGLTIAGVENTFDGVIWDWYTIGNANAITLASTARANHIRVANVTAFSYTTNNSTYNNNIDLVWLSKQGYGNRILVAPSGGNYASLADAINGITDASTSNRYTVEVQGVIDDTTKTITAKPYVDVVGPGTILIGTRCTIDCSNTTWDRIEFIGSLGDSAAYIGGDDSTFIQCCTFRQNTVDAHTTVIGKTRGNAILSQCRIFGNIGMSNTEEAAITFDAASSLVLKDCIVIMPCGGIGKRGATCYSGSSPTFINCIIKPADFNDAWEYDSADSGMFLPVSDIPYQVIGIAVNVLSATAGTNVIIGTTPGGDDVVAGQSLASTGQKYPAFTKVAVGANTYLYASGSGGSPANGSFTIQYIVSCDFSNCVPVVIGYNARAKIIGGYYSACKNSNTIWLTGSPANIDDWYVHNATVINHTTTSNTLRATTSVTGEKFANCVIVGNVLNITGIDGKSSGSSTGTGSEQTIAHGLAAIPTGCKAWITYLVGTRYVTEMIPFDATNVYPTVATGTAYNWRIE